jgi:hypothetical protein
MVVFFAERHGLTAARKRGPLQPFDTSNGLPSDEGVKRNYP